VRADPDGEGFVESLRFRLRHAGDDFDAGRAELAKTLAGDGRIGIAHGRDHALHAGLHEGAGAGPGASPMAARFEVDEERGAARRAEGGFQRDDFRMADAVIGVKAFANDAAVANQDRADHGIGAGQSFAAAGERERAGHPFFGVGRKLRRHLCLCWRPRSIWAERPGLKRRATGHRYNLEQRKKQIPHFVRDDSFGDF